MISGVSAVDSGTAGEDAADAAAAASALAFFFFADLDSERTSGFWTLEAIILTARLKRDGCECEVGIKSVYDFGFAELNKTKKREDYADNNLWVLGIRLLGRRVCFGSYEFVGGRELGVRSLSMDGTYRVLHQYRLALPAMRSSDHLAPEIATATDKGRVWHISYYSLV